MIILKIGGGESINLKGIISDISELKEKVIIVHGANALRDKLGDEMNKPKKILESPSGYSSVFSDETEIDLKMMAYAGLQNKRIVELCQQNGINAVGLSGIDGKAIQGVEVDITATQHRVISSTAMDLKAWEAAQNEPGGVLIEHDETLLGTVESHEVLAK